MLRRGEPGTRRHPTYWRPDLPAGAVVTGPAVIEEYGATVPLHPGFTATVDGYGNLVVAEGPSNRIGKGRRPYGSGRDPSVDPVLLEIVKGSLASIEKEVETAIGRTARSPMIRDAHDFRAGIHDRKLRKLTGRSYSRAGAPDRPRLSTGDDAPGRRLLPQRRVPLRGRHRAPARPVRHRAGVPRR